ncbi:MAG TPA: selenide, water dikinase SelD, partial [Gammaproteobacteria bacterium]|nr:selenide, water dikinase SelD [Gammaproteobacteria bacterium]
MARGAGLDIELAWSGVPIHEGVRSLAAAGHVTGASGRNWSGYGHDVDLPAGFADADAALLTDPQTSGGLLVACAEDSVAEVLSTFERHGFASATVVGRASATRANPRLRVTL